MESKVKYTVEWVKDYERGMKPLVYRRKFGIYIKRLTFKEFVGVLADGLLVDKELNAWVKLNPSGYLQSPGNVKKPVGVVGVVTPLGVRSGLVKADLYEYLSGLYR
jgi:hypothetical protein